MPIFVQQLSTTFAGANQNPLSEGGNWQANTNSGIMRPSQLSSHQAVQVAASGALQSKGWWVGGPSLSNDQYCEITVGTVLPDNASFIGACICAVNAVDTQYEVVVRGPLGATAALIVAKRIAAVQTVLGSIFTTTVNAGDKVMIAKQGTNLTVYLNRVQVTGVGAISDSSLTSGISAFLIQSATGTVGIPGFSAGSVVGAVPNSLMMLGVGS